MASYSNTPSMGELILRTCSRYKNQVAFEDDAGSWSYSELRDDISRCGQYLRSEGYSHQDVVAQLANNRFATFVVQAAAYTFGYQYMGLHTTASVDMHQKILRQANCRKVIVNVDDFPDVSAQLKNAGFEVIEISGEPRPWYQLDAKPITVTSRGNDGARMAFTGGTTGLPKPVKLPHRSLVINTAVATTHIDWPETPRMLLSTPISHGAGSYILPVLLQGGTLVLRNNFDPLWFSEQILAGRINSTFVVPTLIKKLVDIGDTALTKLKGKLELIVYGGAPASVKDLEVVLKNCGQCLQQSYGQTEAPNMVTSLAKEEHVIGDKALGSIGRPTLFSSIEIRSPEGEVVSEPGEVGELYVSGPLVMDGYVDPESGDLHGLEEGWLPTGDLASIDEDGLVYIRGRSKEMIITGGFNVYPILIERVLESDPRVGEAYVVGVPDEYWGEKVVACHVGFVSNEDQQSLKSLVKEKLGKEWSPKDFVELESVPQTSLGKVDRKELAVIAEKLLQS